jgi:uncharacterized protein
MAKEIDNRQEIDLVEERKGRLCAYEIKWGDKKATPPREWLQAYTNFSFEMVCSQNYLDFIT